MKYPNTKTTVLKRHKRHSDGTNALVTKVMSINNGRIYRQVFHKRAFQCIYANLIADNIETIISLISLYKTYHTIKVIGTLALAKECTQKVSLTIEQYDTGFLAHQYINVFACDGKVYHTVYQ